MNEIFDRMKFWRFWKSALMRAAHTMAQTALGMIAVGAAIEEVQWLHILSVCAVAGVISLLKSIVAGVPEMDNWIISFQPDIQNDWDDQEILEGIDVPEDPETPIKK